MRHAVRDYVSCSPFHQPHSRGVAPLFTLPLGTHHSVSPAEALKRAAGAQQRRRREPREGAQRSQCSSRVLFAQPATRELHVTGKQFLRAGPPAVIRKETPFTPQPLDRDGGRSPPEGRKPTRRGMPSPLPVLPAFEHPPGAPRRGWRPLLPTLSGNEWDGDAPSATPSFPVVDIIALYTPSENLAENYSILSVATHVESCHRPRNEQPRQQLHHLQQRRLQLLEQPLERRPFELLQEQRDRRRLLQQSIDGVLLLHQGRRQRRMVQAEVTGWSRPPLRRVEFRAPRTQLRTPFPSARPKNAACFSSMSKTFRNKSSLFRSEATLHTILCTVVL